MNLTPQQERLLAIHRDMQYLKIPLRGKKGKGRYALVSWEDVNHVLGYTWWLDGAGYVCTFHPPYNVKLHRLVMDLKRDDGKIVDHINHDKLDNRRENLRVVSHSVNIFNIGVRRKNKTGCTGVSWLPRQKRWRALIIKDKSRIHLGCFTELALAVQARKNAETKYYGFTI